MDKENSKEFATGGIVDPDKLTLQQFANNIDLFYVGSVINKQVITTEKGEIFAPNKTITDIVKRLKETENMREIENINNKTIDINGLTRNQIEEKFDNETVKKWALKVYDARYNNIKDYEWPLVNPSNDNHHTYEIEFRDGKYGGLLDERTVRLNSPDELPIKAEMIMIELFKQDGIFNQYEEIKWSANEKVVIKNVDHGRMSIK